MELKAMLSLAAPSGLVSALRTAQALTDQAVLGHLAYEGRSTPVYLDAAALALLWMQLTINMAVRGLGGAINVLSSQALGAGNPQLASTWLQLSVMIFAPLIGLLVVGLWLLTGPVVGLFASNQTIGGEDELGSGSGGGTSPGDPVDLAARYAWLSCGYVLPTLWMEALNQWLLAQRIIRPQLVVYTAAFALNLGLNVVFVHGLPPLGVSGLGFDGSPLATTLTRVLQLLALLALLAACRLPLPCLFTPSSSCFLRSRLRTFLAQMGPRTVATALEELALQCVGGLAGRLGAVPTATHNAMLMAFFWLTAPMYGVGSATQQRMGHYLGAGQPTAARSVAGLCAVVDLMLSWTVAAVLMLTRDEIGRLFSSNPAIITMTARITPLVAAAYCLVGIFYSSMAILNGQGRPLPVALAFFIGAFAIAPALGYLLTFGQVACCDFGDGVIPLYGLWFGLIGGYSVTTIISGIAVLRTDWVRVSKRARERSECPGPTAQPHPPMTDDGPLQGGDGSVVGRAGAAALGTADARHVHAAAVSYSVREGGRDGARSAHDSALTISVHEGAGARGDSMQAPLMAHDGLREASESQR